MFNCVATSDSFDPRSTASRARLLKPTAATADPSKPMAFLKLFVLVSAPSMPSWYPLEFKPKVASNEKLAIGLLSSHSVQFFCSDLLSDRIPNRRLFTP